MSIASEIERIKAGKESIRLALSEKTETVVSETLKLEEYAPLITSIETQGEYQSKSAVPSTEQQNIYPDVGYDALSNVLIEATPLEERIINPNQSGVEATPSGNNIGFSKVTVVGDSNLVAGNIKSGTTIFGVTGSFKGEEGAGEDYTKLGTTVTVQARNSFTKGQIFIGEKNPNSNFGLVIESYASKGLPSTAWRATVISEDGSVLIPYHYTMTNSLATSATSFNAYMLNEEGMYQAVTVTHPQAWKDVGHATLQGSKWFIKQDGSVLGCISNGGFYIIDVNKKNMTTEASFISEIKNRTGISIAGFSDGEITGYNAVPVFIKDYIFMDANISYNNGASNIYCLIALKYSTTSKTLTFQSIVAQGTAYAIVGVQQKNVGYIEDGRVILGVNRNDMFYVLSFGSTITIEKEFEASGTINSISKNGKYCVIVNRGYEINIESGTLTQKTIVNTAYMDSTGKYFQYGSAVYDVTTGNQLYSGADTPLTPYFEIADGECYFSVSNKIYLGYSDVQYYISNTQAYIETADRIYGIVPKDMAMEEKGTAQALFNTFTLETTE